MNNYTLHSDLLVALVEWYKARSSLSVRCKDLGISSSDKEKWLQEVNKISDKLYKECEKHHYDLIEVD